MNKKNNKDFFYLLEYSIAKGKSTSQQNVSLQEDDGDENNNLDDNAALGYEKKGANKPPSQPPSQPAMDDVAGDEEMPTEAPSMDGDPSNNIENGDESDADKDEGKDVEKILGDLIRLHSDKLDSLFDYMATSQQQLQQVQAQTNSLPLIQSDINHMRDQIRSLTPPSPLESGNALIATSGGVRVEDYWNNWLAKNKRDDRLTGNPYYPESAQDKSGDLYLDAKNVPDLSKDELQKSFFGSDDLEKRGY